MKVTSKRAGIVKAMPFRVKLDKSELDAGQDLLTAGQERVRESVDAFLANRRSTRVNNMYKQSKLAPFVLARQAIDEAIERRAPSLTIASGFSHMSGIYDSLISKPGEGPESGLQVTSEENMGFRSVIKYLEGLRQDVERYGAGNIIPPEGPLIVTAPLTCYIGTEMLQAVQLD